MKNKNSLFFILFVFLFSLVPEQQYVFNNSMNNPTQLTYCNQRLDSTILQETEKIVSNMTLKEKIGQMFIVRIESLDDTLSLEQANDTYEYGITSIEENKLILDEYPVGGVILFNKNMTSKTQLKTLIDNLKQKSSYPLFIAVDEEGGSVSRIANSQLFDVKNYGSNESIGNTKDMNYAKQVASYIGTYLSELGFNLNFAPVADINSNPNNPVIGSRSFGDNSKLVSQMVISQIQGYHDQNIMTCVKHYPGHGDTFSDTHNGFVSLNKNFTELLDSELIPFLQTLHMTDMIMVSHITLPEVTNSQLPSSLSESIIKKQLREYFNYQGVVISDALDMQSITNFYSSTDAILLGLNAGIDIFLMPYNFKEAYNSVYQMALKDTTIENRINESVKRIIYLKLKYGLL